MNTFGLKKIEKRILEINHILGDEDRIKNMPGITEDFAKGELEKANRPLIAELDELKEKRGFIRDRRNLIINILTISTSLFIAFFVPIWETSWNQKQQERADIQSLYQTIIANEDIFISNFNAVKNSQNSNLPISTPEFHIEFPISENVHKIIQRELGIDQYRFLLYFLNQTELLNQEIRQIRYEIADSEKVLPQNKRVLSYQKMMESLEKEGWEDYKFNYIDDASCLIYMFQKSFSFIDIAEREETISCSNDSLNRLFYHFGYIPAETPNWLIPELRGALNEREKGLGDRLVE